MGSILAAIVGFVAGIAIMIGAMRRAQKKPAGKTARFMQLLGGGGGGGPDPGPP